MNRSLREGDDGVRAYEAVRDVAVATSLGDAAMSDKNCVLHLRVPKGTPGMYVGDVSNFASIEREVLLARGARWRADEVVHGPDGKIHVYGEVL